jgi:hypothetical protein
MTEPMMKTRGAMDPPTRPLYWPSRLFIAAVAVMVCAMVYSLAAWTLPTVAWLWPMCVLTLVGVVALVVRDAMVWVE